MQASDPWLVSLLVIASVGLLCLLIVIIHMYFFGNWSELRITLLMMLHVTLFFKNLADLPTAWKDNLGLCKFMGCLHCYSSISNIIVIALLSAHHYSYINAENYAERINEFIRKYGFMLIVVIPLIAVLPFSTDSYGISLGQWCDLPATNNTANDWDLVLFFYPSLIILFITSIQLSYSTYRVAKYEPELFMTLFLSTGSYILISVVVLVPRIVFRLSHSKSFTSSNVNAVITLMPLELAGILYFCVYLLGLYFLPSRPLRRSISAVHSSSSVRLSSLKQIIDDMMLPDGQKSFSQSNYSNSAPSNIPTDSILTGVVENPLTVPLSSPNSYEGRKQQKEDSIELNQI
jgi:hypothetical protein